MTNAQADDGAGTPAIDSSVPHSARIWNYWLGGKDYYDVDRRAGDAILDIAPGMRAYARADRAFLGRAVTHLAREAGIRQFLDIGTGLPTRDNTHEVAQRIAPESRVVYVDNDPLVLAHARALLGSSPEGATAYLDADLRDPGAILSAAHATLDFSRPVAVMLLGIVNYIADPDEAKAIIGRLLDEAPSGSYLALSHTSVGPGTDEAVAYWNEHGTPKLTQRTAAQVTELFDGLELLDPGVVPCSRWRPDTPSTTEPVAVHIVGGIGRKP
ncbi:SAM-dependent methyltransferase [Streptomyces sp. PT12]|uniref:SAM-dependent methyltransferase n=1 Tax=Streptomyces sp. PT12 TaxID=1510197 RepID=UPI000DE2F156|nr:SAM-dependent methyltransferase [Streptomyces sp. PT12]RBM20741.1 translation initiation factor IF-2 [Streptomyces sp. PT12]